MQSFAKVSHSARRTSTPQRREATPRSVLHTPQRLSRTACSCGGTCPNCRDEVAAQPKLAINEPGDAFEQAADRVAEQVMRMPDPNPPADQIPSTGTISSQWLQRRANDPHGAATAPPIVHNVLYSPGHLLDAATRAFMEPRFGTKFGDVRVHTGAEAAESARSVDALAYTVGRDIVFGQDQYSPGSTAGRKLLAHEMVHVQQQRDGAAQVQRTPASKVSCANALPLHVPGSPDVADPVGVITAAEDRANQMLDDVIGELDFTRQQIIGGAPATWPTISDAIAEGLRLMGLNPDDPTVWTAPAGTGERSVALLLRRLRLIRGTIGAGSFFFVCLGTGRATLGPCVAPSGDLCATAVATTCPGHFLTAFCPGFWTDSTEDQAARIIHESSHNFATFIGHTGRFTNAECFARLVQQFAGVPEALQRVDLCPNP